MPINQSSSGMCFKGQIFSKFLTESQQLACGLRAFLTVRVDHLLCCRMLGVTVTVSWWF